MNNFFKVIFILYSLQTYNIYTTHQPLQLECGGLSLCVVIARVLIDKVAWCSCLRIRDKI